MLGYSVIFLNIYCGFSSDNNLGFIVRLSDAKRSLSYYLVCFLSEFNYPFYVDLF